MKSRENQHVSNSEKHTIVDLNRPGKAIEIEDYDNIDKMLGLQLYNIWTDCKYFCMI